MPTLVVLFPPAEGAEVKWHKMWQACATLEDRFPALRGRVLRAPGRDAYRDLVRDLAASLPEVEIVELAPEPTE